MTEGDINKNEHPKVGVRVRKVARSIENVISDISSGNLANNFTERVIKPRISNQLKKIESRMDLKIEEEPEFTVKRMKRSGPKSLHKAKERILQEPVWERLEDLVPIIPISAVCLQPQPVETPVIAALERIDQLGMYDYLTGQYVNFHDFRTVVADHVDNEAVRIKGKIKEFGETLEAFDPKINALDFSIGKFSEECVKPRVSAISSIIYNNNARLRHGLDEKTCRKKMREFARRIEFISDSASCVFDSKIKSGLVEITKLIKELEILEMEIKNDRSLDPDFLNPRSLWRIEDLNQDLGRIKEVFREKQDKLIELFEDAQEISQAHRVRLRLNLDSISEVHSFTQTR